MKIAISDEEKLQVITNEVCQYYSKLKNIDIKPGDLLTTSHARIYSETRYMIFYFARKITDLSLATIAGAFNRDHASASHGVNLIQNLVKVNGMGQHTTKIAGRIQFRIRSLTDISLIKAANAIRKEHRRRNHFRAMFRKSRMVKRLIAVA